MTFVIIWIAFIIAGYQIGKDRKMGSTKGALWALFLLFIGVIIVACSAPAEKPKEDKQPEPAAKPDIPDQIVKLLSLRDQGAITPEEYEKQKQRILE